MIIRCGACGRLYDDSRDECPECGSLPWGTRLEEGFRMLGDDEDGVD